MNKFSKLSIISSALALPLTVLSGTLVSWYLKGNNPDHVDITAGLAYLRPILVTSFTVFIVLALLSLLFALIGLKKQEDRGLIRLALALALAVIVTSSLAGFAQTRISAIEDSYRERRVETLLKNISDSN